MKKIFLLALIAISTLASCSDEIETNAPSIQGEVNGDFFRTKNTSATINDDGSVSFTGATDSETITLKTSSVEIGSYTLGSGSANEATFQTLEGNFYSTGVNGMGQIQITKIQQGKLSGEFYFDAVQDTEEDTLNFNKGFFFEVPLTNPGAINVGATCMEAQATSAEAKQTYEDADPNDSGNFEAACLAYQNALEDEIEACGDDDGSLQTILDGLDCPGNNAQGNITVTAGTLPIDFDEVSVVLDAGVYKITGETSAPNNYTIYFEIDENATGTDMVQNFEIELTSVFTPSNMPTPFTSEITTNTSGSLMGTFYGTVSNSDGGDLELTSGTLDLTF